MIDHFLGDDFGVLSCQFWSTVLQSGARLPIHTLNYWAVREVSGARFLTVGVFECDIVHRRSVARGALVAHRHTYAPLAAEHRSTA